MFDFENTPGIGINSCTTPSIFTWLTAAPGREESMILLREFPYQVKVGDVISIKEKAKSTQRYKDVLEVTGGRAVPAWLEADHENLTGTVKEIPTRDQIEADRCARQGGKHDSPQRISQGCAVAPLERLNDKTPVLLIF